MNKEQIMGLVRHSLTFLGGIIISKGFITESSYTDIVGALMTLVGSIWSIASKK